ncbi:hypothetical protein Omen_076 [Erwinia phage Omen]|uniref:Uncharacterized protein n=1 Tax=Erwinia phage Harbringer TaxID=3158978 RepID=A0AAU8EH87_9CAUD
MIVGCWSLQNVLLLACQTLKRLDKIPAKCCLILRYG